MNTYKVFYRFVGVCILAFGIVTPVHASVIEWSFEGTVASGSYAGTDGSGVFRYDTDVIAGVGTEVITASLDGGLDGFLTVSFIFLGQSFTEENDAQFLAFGYPALLIEDGLPTYLDFALVDGASGVDFANADIESIIVQGPLTPGQNVRFTMPIEVGTFQVPEPSTIALLLGPLALLGWRRVSPSQVPKAGT